MHRDTPIDTTSADGDLLRRARAFDEAALTEIYTTHSEPLYRYIFHHTGDAQTAEDLTAEAFRRLLMALRTGGGPTEHAKAWLYRVAHNLVVDELRRRKHRDHEALDNAPFEALRDSQQNPEERAWTAIASTHVRQALVELSPDQRQVIVLRFLEGMDNAEIADITGKSVGAVKALLHRGLESLRDKVGTTPQRARITGQQAAAFVRC